MIELIASNDLHKRKNDVSLHVSIGLLQQGWSLFDIYGSVILLTFKTQIIPKNSTARECNYM